MDTQLVLYETFERDGAKKERERFFFATKTKQMQICTDAPYFSLEGIVFWGRGSRFPHDGADAGNIRHAPLDPFSKGDDASS